MVAPNVSIPLSPVVELGGVLRLELEHELVLAFEVTARFRLP